MPLGLSVLGENDAYQAVVDGSQLPPPYFSLDIASPGIYVGQPPLVDGDFDDDGVYGCLDVDALTSVIAAGTNASAYDLDGDAVVNGTDLDLWLSEAGGVNVGAPFRYGDANLDGVVDGQDFIAWNSNKFMNTTAWCRGNFNADEVVDGQDFIVWNTNKFQSSNRGVVAVPEPRLWSLLLGSLLAIACARPRGLGQGCRLTTMAPSLWRTSSDTRPA